MNDITPKEAIANLNHLYGMVAPDIQRSLDVAIKALEEKRPKGEWVRKEDVIHRIAKQYSEHNELVPIWLSIGDMRGGAE